MNFGMPDGKISHSGFAQESTFYLPSEFLPYIWNLEL